jgi:hypothetical protein
MSQDGSPDAPLRGKQAFLPYISNTMLDVGWNEPTSRAVATGFASSLSIAQPVMSSGVSLSSEGSFSARNQMALNLLSRSDEDISFPGTEGDLQF